MASPSLPQFVVFVRLNHSCVREIGSGRAGPQKLLEAGVCVCVCWWGVGGAHRLKWARRDITLRTKVHIVKVTIFQ